jgi:8-oxo-dGTP pyrophosphatase MutT (NUDIX family)
MAELRDLYDIDHKLTGKAIRKGEPVPDGFYIIVVLIFIENNDGKFLVQRRSHKFKDGKLATTGGHVKTGETSVEGILEEVREEIGLNLRPSDLTLYFAGREDSTHVFFDDYYAKIDIEDITKLELQDNEVDEVLWMTPDEIYAACETGEFLSNHVEEFTRLIEWKEKNGN